MQLIQAPDPILTMVATPVDIERREPQDIDRVIEAMFRLVTTHHAVGLAAPQIGRSIRGCVIDCRTSQHRQSRLWIGGEKVEADHLKPLALLNPVVTHSGESDVSSEGCLSLPGQTFRIWRPQYIRVKAFDRSFQPIWLAARGFIARVIQHEIDHLNGILLQQRAVLGNSQ